ncbi:ABC transporter permease [Marinobacterium aestuarii]|uniref:ABC transporter permease n=1 Tax=Marinobacterium aestuarii TaxID=1821621 RepID=A0A1A9EXT9_9GAMM|nr:ABC transporter permease [Marinobacterium aestuarii]ANG62632.1 ABC transporter permease [Marinobacterium aestuarii]
MLNLIFKRLVLALMTLATVCVLVFAMTEYLPGDVCSAYLGRDAQGTRLDNCRLERGLDRPALQRFGDWTSGVLQGDLGTSLKRNKPINDLVGNRMRNTLVLGVSAALVGIPLAVALGVFAALRRDRGSDIAISTLSIFTMTIPEFVTASLLILVFSVQLQWFPAVVTVRPTVPIVELLPNVVLPMLTLALVMMAHILRMVRSSMIDVMASDFVQMARLKGVPLRQIVWRHALPNAMLPAINIIALTIAWLLGGVVIIEQVFNYPGIGTLMIRAIQDRDLPLVQAIALLLAAVYVACNLLADLCSLALNPRLRTAR